MTTIDLDIRTKRNQKRRWIKTIEKNWLRILILALAVHIFFNKDISIEFNLNTAGQTSEPLVIQPVGYEGEQRASTVSSVSGQKWNRPAASNVSAPPKANDFSNLTFILNPDYARRKKVDRRIVKYKRKVLESYIKRFAPAAKAEWEKYNIPVSITLAQGLLESNAGDSRLARESNNHFGIKCRTKCRGCTCRNYTDDDIYDMFRVFGSAWESYREHSILLNSARYKHLLDLAPTDYNSWAHGLKKAGYATDKRYAEKLIRIIEELNLDRFDRSV